MTRIGGAGRQGSREVGRRRIALAAACALLCATPVVAQPAPDVRQWLGRPIVGVRVEVGGGAIAAPGVVQLIETRAGDLLSMERVRESIDHLVGLGRFQDVRVYGTPAGDGVALRWVLVPLRRITAIDIHTSADVSENAIVDAIADRVGAQPVVSRLEDIVEVVRSFHMARGYRQAAVEPRVSEGAQPEAAVLDLHVTAGPRSAIRDVRLQGDARRPTQTLLQDLRLEPGQPYDAPAIERRLADYEERLRDGGYYEARATVTATFDDRQTAVDLAVDIRRGPLVRVVFAGDPLPENRREALVPIREERSVDLDLLEDASRNIEMFLRQQGYRAAEAPYLREARNDELVLTFTVDRGPLHRLASLEVVGAHALPAADIAPLLVLREGEPFADHRVLAVVAALTELYRARGFARAVVTPEIVVQAPEGRDDLRQVAVTLAVIEGPRTMVGDVALTGVNELDEAALRQRLTLTAGRPFYRPLLEADRGAIDEAYRREGFQQVRVEPQLTLADDDRRVDVRWRITEGPRVLVDRILVSGNAHTSDDLIRREIVLQPNSPLSADAIVESQRRLAALGLFRRVRIVELPHGASATRDVLVEVEEAPATTIAYGGGLEAGRRLRTGDDGGQAEERIDVAPRGFFEVSRRNLWGKNRSVSLFTRVSLRPRDPGAEPDDPTDTGGYGFNEYRVVGTFREPHLLARPGDLQVTGFLEQAIRSSFNFSRRGVRLDYGRRVGGAVTVSGRYAFDRTKLFDTKIAAEDQLLIDRLFPQVRLSTLTASVLRDTRDDVIDPVRGTVVGSDLTFALRALGSEVGFVKSFSQAFVYRQLPGRVPFTLVAGLRTGVALGFTRVLEDGTVVDDVPASERFFAGGDSTVRGFVLDRLGTRDTLNPQGFPTGGSGLLVVNLELRSPYWKGVGGVAFFDAGNVFRRAGDIRPDALRPAAGGGLRYRSPLGPLRVDFGFNLGRQQLPTGARERGMVFHLSLGQAF